MRSTIFHFVLHRCTCLWADERMRALEALCARLQLAAVASMASPIAAPMASPVASAIALPFQRFVRRHKSRSFMASLTGLMVASVFMMVPTAKAQQLNLDVTTVTVGTFAVAVAINPVTNKIYVVNRDSANVTVIDGATNGTTTVAAGTSPVAVAVNPVTNQIYVVNSGSANVTVIDGATNNTATVAAGTNPRAVAVNPATNQIYVANSGSANVTVIDGDQQRRYDRRGGHQSGCRRRQPGDQPDLCSESRQRQCHGDRRRDK